MHLAVVSESDWGEKDRSENAITLTSLFLFLFFGKGGGGMNEIHLMSLFLKFISL